MIGPTTAFRVAANLLARSALLGAACFVLTTAVASQAVAAKSIGGFVGGLTGNSPGIGFAGASYVQPRDVAVYTGGDADPSNDKIFVAESFSISAANDPSRIDRLDGDGNWERAWGRDVIKSGATGDTGTGYEICTVAADCKQGVIGPQRGELTAPSGLAVDQANGWLYVMDRSNFRIQKFDLNGSFLAAFGKGVNTGTSGNLDVCTNAGPPTDVCGAGAAGSGAGQFGMIAANTTTATLYPKLDVNQTTHDVFVVDPGNGAGGNRRVLQFSSAGAFIRGWGYGVDTGTAQFEVCTTASTCQAGNAAGVANGQFANNPQHIAVGNDGVVYVSDANTGAAANRIMRFDSDLAPTEPGPPFPDASAALLTPLITGSPMPDAATLGLEFDPGTGHLLVTRDPAASGNTVVQELSDPSGVAAIAATHNFALDTAINHGLAYNPGRNIVYLTFSGTCSACGGSAAGLFLLADNGANAPSSTVSLPTTIGATTATLSGTVTANGSARYRFEVSTDGTTFAPVGSDVYVSGSGPVPVTAQATGLVPSTLYRVRIVASKVTALSTTASATSGESVFATDAAPPTATTLPASPRRTTSAGLQARVNPNGAPTTYRFEYGPTATYGRSAPIPDGSAGAGGLDKLVGQEVTGLLPATTYHYRIVAESAYGTAIGSDMTFVTRTAVEPPVGRGYELVTEPDKASGPGEGSHGNHSQFGGEVAMAAGYPSTDGERFLSAGLDGPLLTHDAKSVYVKNYYQAERCPPPSPILTPTPQCSELPAGGWTNRALANRPNYASSTVTPFLGINEVDPALSQMTFGNGGGLAMLFPEQASWAPVRPQYLRDWGGNWKLLAPLDDSHGILDAGRFIPRFSADASSLVLSTRSTGLLGSGDPSADIVGGGAFVYRVDLAGGVADDFSDRGPSEWVGVCTGSGAQRTTIPDVVAGKVTAQPCPDAIGRDVALTNTRGSSLPVGPLASTSSRRNVISADGSRIFFLSPDPNATGAISACSGTGVGTACPPQLYAWQAGPAGERTVRWISRSVVANQDATLLGSAGMRYEGASTDGDKVFFRSNAPLTADDPNGGLQVPGGVTTGNASSTSWDLYMYDMPDAPDADLGAGSLTRISAGPTSTADSNVSIDGDSAALRFASDDGERVYFTTAAPLPGVPSPTNGTTTSPGGTSTTTETANLYSYDGSKPAAQRWRFVARLPRSDVSGTITALNACATTAGTEGGVRVGDPAVGLGASPNNCVQGTADGEFITFWTLGRLVTGDPELVSGDMYAFDAAGDELTLLSAPQGGTGGSYTCLTAGAVQCHGDAGFIQEFSGRMRLQVPTHPADPSERSRLFESRSSLVPNDLDNQMDVYLWIDGNLSLMSSGISDAGAYESGVDRTGRDAFLKTAAGLTWQDNDAVADIYDARKGGGFIEPPPPVLCAALTDGCQGITPPPASPVPRTDSGTDNGNATRTARSVLTLRPPSRRARRNAARAGALPLSVGSTSAGAIKAVGRMRIGKRSPIAGRGRVRLARPGDAVLRLRLTSMARRRLLAGHDIRLTVELKLAGARTRSTSVTLPGAVR